MPPLCVSNPPTHGCLTGCGCRSSIPESLLLDFLLFFNLSYNSFEFRQSQLLGKEIGALINLVRVVEQLELKTHPKRAKAVHDTEFDIFGPSLNHLEK